jgi:hypothetical protein
MTNNPYITTLLEMGYDEQDCSQPLSHNRQFPCTIYGRHFETEEQYNQELHEYMNGL